MHMHQLEAGTASKRQSPPRSKSTKTMLTKALFAAAVAAVAAAVPFTQGLKWRDLAAPEKASYTYEHFAASLARMARLSRAPASRRSWRA
eukprot:COSAG05_NODE_18013_length_315_cov_1.000000_1_plen_90_part_01